MKDVMEKSDASDEAALVQRAAAGSAEAFAQLVRRHQLAVRWCLTRYVRDPATVDDLAQEVFVCAHQQLTAQRTISNLRPWLLGVARNTAREHLRATSRRREREQGPLQIQLAQWRAERLEMDTDHGTQQEETFAALHDCLGRLAPESRRVVEQHYFEGQKVEVIAKRQGRSGGALRMMLLRIRAVLRECIRGRRDQQF
jgi:RNA polymerase sigma-70 factor (ECF subfamily)